MLPYAMLMIELRCADGNRVRTAANELYSNGVLFDVSASQADSLPPEECVFCFLDHAQKCYHSVYVSCFRLIYIGRNEAALQYCLVTEEPAFSAALKRLSSDYMRYTGLKQQDDLTMMEEMTGFSFDDGAFPMSAAAWKKTVTAEPVCGDYNLLPVEIAISLDLPHLWTDFLRKDRKDFLPEYWEENALAGHPAAAYKITHIYIGSQFCEFLLPDETALVQILKKTDELSLIPVIVFPPMRCDGEEKYADRIGCVCHWAENNHRYVELVINDVGTARLARQLAEAGKIRPESFSMTAGILLNKRKKDFRIKYRSCCDTEQAAYAQTAVDAEFYRDYLRDQFGIWRISYEACGYPIQIGSADAVLHFPLYQMNTSGYCTLHALYRYGDRGHQAKQVSCKCDCEKHAVLYPEGLPMIGLGNSLFGCSMKELNDAAVLNALIRDGVRRLVIRL